MDFVIPFAVPMMVVSIVTAIIAGITVFYLEEVSDLDNLLKPY